MTGSREGARVLQLAVSEVFTTVQGEGRHAGQLATFLRLAGCNLSCSWCDAAYTWDWTRYARDKQVSKQAVEELAHDLAELPGRIVVTGGEPLLQAGALAQLQLDPALEGRVWDVETNGTRPLGATWEAWESVTCSPKVGPSAGQSEQLLATHPEILAHPRVDFKFVVADQRDLLAAQGYVDAHGLTPEQVWLMPEGTSVEQVAGPSFRWVAEEAISRGWNVSNRLHILAWGNERGR